MTHSNNTAHHHEEGYLLGDWHVFPKSGVVAKGSYHTHAEPKVMQVLECLIMAQGKMVSREALIERVWPRVVVNEEVLTRAISELRTLLGDVSRERRYIITVPKRGYKLIMPALPLPDSSQAQSGTGETRQSAKTSEPEGRYGLILTAVAAIRRVLERPLTAYLCLSMLGVFSWVNSNGTDNNTHLITLQSNTCVVQHQELQPVNSDAILRGSVQIHGDLARVSLQIVDAHSASLLWRSSFECVVDTPVIQQRQIARYTGEQLQQSLAAYI